jgi:hypothetical protein
MPLAPRSNSQTTFEAHRGKPTLSSNIVTTERIIDDGTVIQTTQTVKKNKPEYSEAVEEKEPYTGKKLVDWLLPGSS